MFKFLKDKLKKTISSFTDKIKEEGETVESKHKELEQEPEEDIDLTDHSEKETPKEKKTEEPLGVEEEVPVSEVESEKEGKQQPTQERSIEKTKIIGEKQEVGAKETSISEETSTELDSIEEKSPKIREEVAERKIIEKAPVQEKGVEPETEIIEEKPKKKGFFDRFKEKVASKVINEEQFENFFTDLEIALLENNVAVEVIDKIKQDMKKVLVDVPIRRRKIDETVRKTLKNSIDDLFDVSKIDLLSKVMDKKPFVVCFFGINGSGKTTTIAKITQLLKKNGISVVLAAADTFRAASIEQLKLHGDKLDVKVIRHDYGSDPAAVAFDAIKHAESRDIDVVLVDTAGRQHSNVNLVEEMKKIVRVAKPDLKIFVGESITGNDCVEQAQQFNDAVEIDAIILTKADVDEKGGAAVSVSYVTGKPIMYFGVGQEYDDLKAFDPQLVVQGLGL